MPHRRCQPTARRKDRVHDARQPGHDWDAQGTRQDRGVPRLGPDLGEDVAVVVLRRVVPGSPALRDFS